MNYLLPLLCLFSFLQFTGSAHCAPAQDFTLFYSNNVQGETEPCG